MSKSFSVPRGTADILPEEIPVWQAIERQARRRLYLHGYQEIRTPIFEETALFARSIGQTSDVVQKQMLNLAAQARAPEEAPRLSGLSLRPEGTAAVVRAYIEHSLHKRESLSKLFYLSPMFRGERPQKGRLRQFHQLGVEAIGEQSASPYLDAEVLALGVDILKDLGLKEFELKINTLGSREDKETFSKTLRGQIKPFLADLCPDCRQRFDRNVFRTLDCKQRTCQAVVARLSIGHDHLSPESRDYFQAVLAVLDQMGIAYTVCPTMVRGLDYYTHTVFEISAPALGSQDALGAGGRYNHLVEDLGGPAVDAIGFALGLERIILALPAEQAPRPAVLDAWLIVPDAAGFPQAVGFLHTLRQNGVACDVVYRPSSFKSQLRQANKQGVGTVLILGEDELRRGVVTVKDMESGEQEQLDWTDMPALCRQLRKERC